MKNLDRMYKYTRVSENLIQLTHVPPEIADTLTPKLCPEIQDFIFCLIRDGCIKDSLGDDLNYVDASGEAYIHLSVFSCPGEEYEITNFYITDEYKVNDPEFFKKVEQQKVIFK